MCLGILLIPLYAIFSIMSCLFPGKHNIYRVNGGGNDSHKQPLLERALDHSSFILALVILLFYYSAKLLFLPLLLWVIVSSFSDCYVSSELNRIYVCFLVGLPFVTSLLKIYLVLLDRPIINQWFGLDSQRAKMSVKLNVSLNNSDERRVVNRKIAFEKMQDLGYLLVAGVICYYFL